MSDPFPEPGERDPRRRTRRDRGSGRRVTGADGHGVGWLEPPRAAPAAPAAPAEQPVAAHGSQPAAHTSRRSARQAEREATGGLPIQPPAAEPPDEDPEPERRRSLWGRFWLLLVAVLMVAWSATVLLDLPYPPIGALAALSPAITVLAVPVVALGVGRRQPVPAALATLAAALPWVLVAGYGAAGPGPTSPTAGTPVRVIFVNADAGKADADQVSELVQDYAAEVVVVTELTDALAHDLAVGGMSTRVNARYVGDGIGIWTRDEFTEPREVEGLSRPAAAGVLAVGQRTGDPPSAAVAQLGLLVAHAGGTSLIPGADARDDLDRMGGMVPPTARRVIVGDLNATPWQAGFRRLTGSEWHDAADVVGRGLRPTWPSWSPLPISPLDHVLVAGDVGVSGVDTANIAGTDHRALIVTLVLPA